MLRPAVLLKPAVARVAAVRARTPLRVKLVATLLLLVILALAGSGVAASTTMRSYLIGRVDTQLASAQRPLTEHQGDGDADGDGHGGSRLPSAYVTATTGATGAIVSGPTSNLVNADEPLPRLPRLTGAQSKAAGSHLFTVGAVRGDGQWRVLASPVTLSDGTTGTVLIAQSLADVQSTAKRLVLLLVIIGAATLVILAGVGYVIVRASLRPLREVERTAAQIAAGDLTHRVPAAHPRTEVGQLSQALNTMLTKIETAFAERGASEQAARSSEERMRLSEAAARQSEERMRRFVADASHELRSPLTTIRGFAELYRQGAVTENADVTRLMRRIEDEGKRMGVLVEDLLLLARLDQERPLTRAPVDLLALAGDAVQDIRTIAADRPVRLEVGATDPPPVVLGDEGRLRQVLANLLTNAVKHTAAGTPVTVTVTTGIGADSGQPSVTLTVSDEGPGLSAEAAARVFERFYRADPSRNRADGNTGLGLAIVAALVAGHGGTVGVDTVEGAGATFRVELPLAAVATTAPEAVHSNLAG